MNHQQNWTETGEVHTQGVRHEILKRIQRMEWIRVPRPEENALSLPMMPGENIKECIRELRIPKVSAISWNCLEFAPLGFYGIEGNYKNGRARVYIIDEGSKCVPVMSEFWPIEERTP